MERFGPGGLPSFGRGAQSFLKPSRPVGANRAALGRNQSGKVRSHHRAMFRVCGQVRVDGRRREGAGVRTTSERTCCPSAWLDQTPRSGGSSGPAGKRRVDRFRSSPIERESLERFSTQFIETFQEWLGSDVLTAVVGDDTLAGLNDRLAAIRRDPLARRIPLNGIPGKSVYISEAAEARIVQPGARNRLTWLFGSAYFR